MLNFPLICYNCSKMIARVKVDDSKEPFSFVVACQDCRDHLFDIVKTDMAFQDLLKENKIQ